MFDFSEGLVGRKIQIFSSAPVDSNVFEQMYRVVQKKQLTIKLVVKLWSMLNVRTNEVGIMKNDLNREPFNCVHNTRLTFIQDHVQTNGNCISIHPHMCCVCLPVTQCSAHNTQWFGSQK